ncbi:LTA synthase family protein [Paenibacillus agricola]|uniref:LTA synthase family protein n=1 Tax=Paenibacillus agricola TaxID=2716264 RepID=A0ABX0JHU8_9BACL|nr:LTA synthase family protein [Paenibacillus agricola]NHN33954.1 LTA synthase family protein [Paenibacillus agricola]
MLFRPANLLRSAAVCIVAFLFIVLSTSLPYAEPTHPLVLKEKQDDWIPEDLQRNPNIIIVLSEAFWDPTKIQGLRFSRDPIPTFHALQEKYTNGTMLSPQFGGGTANVELEVLTGNSMRFLNSGEIAYEKMIHHPIDSLASILGRQGYTTTAINPFDNWYANSLNVYRRFGFSRVIPIEFFNPNEYVGPYMGDHAVAKRIIEESKRSDGPDLIFTNTMENHYHYWSDKFKSNSIQVKGPISDEALAIVETLAQGIHGSDAMLQELVKYFGQLKEPTIVVFFGDHLPHLETDYYVYRESQYIQGTDDPNFLDKMYRTPLLIWNNYLPANKEIVHFSPSFLSPYLLNLAKLKGSAYTDFLYKLSQKIPVIPPKPYYEAMGINEADLSEYEQRQQAIFAEREDAGEYADEFTGRLMSEATQPFIIGYGEPTIESVTPESINVSEGFVADWMKTMTLIVRGGRFGIGSILFADGKPLPTVWQTETSLSASLPKDMYEQPRGGLELQVRVVDSQDHVLAQSRNHWLPLTGNIQ